LTLTEFELWNRQAERIAQRLQGDE